MKLKVAVVQESPVFFDLEKTIEKVEQITIAQASKGCQLLLFPESFIPGYPRGFSFGAKIGNRTKAGREMYAAYYKSSFDIEGSEMDRLTTLSRDYNIYLVIGVTEKQNNTGSLYCSMLYISPTHGLLGVHRKIKPTGTERLIWGESDGKDLVSFETKIGKLGGLICWENYMPLARMSMYQQGVEIYLAPTADSRDAWTSTMQTIALEGRCFVLSCNQFFTKDMYPESYQDELKDLSDPVCRGGSIIVSPLGEILAGPLYNQPGILEATINLDDIIESKLDFDVIGHYARKDIFSFSVEGQPKRVKEG